MFNYSGMKPLLLFLFLFFFFFQGCSLRQREEALTKKEAFLNQWEQELLLKEKTLQIKEEDLLKREQKIDSTSLLDSTVYNAALNGTWDVTMTCTETSCPGSAVGDTKSETWEIAYQENKVIARAMANNQLVRVYSGFFTGNTLELVENVENTGNQPVTRIVVRLRLSNENLLEGQREIERIGECKILYNMVLNKKTNSQP